MGKAIQKYQGAGGGEIVSLNIDDLNVIELERRLEMSVATSAMCWTYNRCDCWTLTTCGTYCF